MRNNEHLVWAAEYDALEAWALRMAAAALERTIPWLTKADNERTAAAWRVEADRYNAKAAEHRVAAALGEAA